MTARPVRAGGVGAVDPGQGTKSHIPQAKRSPMAQQIPKISCAAAQ